MTIHLDNLPQELLIQIFKHLPSTDLISLSALCHSFNNAINNCSELMEKFTIYISNSRKQLEWNPVRKYSKIFVSCDNFGDFSHIFEDLGDGLKEFVMRYSKIESSELIKILKNSNKLKFLNFHAVEMTAKPEDFEVDLPELSLDKFYFLNLNESTELVLKMLGKSSVIELDMIGDFKYPQILKNFLKSQKSLKSFKLYNQCDEFMLFDDDFLSDVEFKLKELRLSNWDMYNQLTPFFRNFIEHHKECLEIFESNNTKIFNFLPPSSSLKSVTIPSMQFTNPNVYENVEDLTITIGSIDNWSRSFPGVKNVKIIQTYPEPVDALMEVENCSKLESLELNYQKICGLNLPMLKKLILKFIDGFLGCPIKPENMKKIEKIVIEKCADCEWLIECLESEDLKLKFLSVQKTEMSEKLKDILERNLGKIEKIEISD